MINKSMLSKTTAALVLGQSIAGPAMADGDLKIYNWGEYTNPELVKKFEAATGIKVTIDTYDSNETLLAKLKSGATGYDIIVPGDYMVAIMVREGLLEPVDPKAMPNFKNIDARWTTRYWDPDNLYSIPWQWGTTAIQIDTATVKDPPDSLSLLFDPPEELKGRINMMRDVNDVMNMALRYLGLPRCNSNPADLKQASDLLLRQKQWVRTYSSDPKQMIASGDVAATMFWNGYAMRARDEKPSLKYVYPKEGFTGWMDNVAVPKGAPNIENAKIFMNFLMEPANAALVSNYARYMGGIKGAEAFMDPELLKAPEIMIPAGVPEPEFVPPCDDKVVKLYDRIWTNLLR